MIWQCISTRLVHRFVILLHICLLPFSFVLTSNLKFIQFSLFDVPLHYNFKEAGDRGRDFDMRSIWDGTVVQRGPLNAVTFVDNHEYVHPPRPILLFD